jgi:hypothetical protein
MDTKPLQEGQQGQVRFFIPDPKVFSDQPKDVKDVINPGRTTVFNKARVFLFDHAEYPPEGGIYRYFKGCLYPDNHFPFQQAGYANEHVKKMLLSYMKFFAGNKPMAFFAVWTKKSLENTLRSIIAQGDHYFAQTYYRGEYPRYYSKPCKELKKFSDAFFTSLGMPQDIVDGMSRIIMTVFEHDNAYMCRLQDMAGEVNYRNLINTFPSEVKRIMGIFIERDPAVNNHEKIGRFVNLISIAWKVPKFKRAIKMGLSVMDWQKLCFDNAEYYHAMLRSDYYVRGQHFVNPDGRTGRLFEFLQMHKDAGVPEPMMMEIQK